MIHKFINQLITDASMLVRGINADGIQGCFFPEKYHILPYRVPPLQTPLPFHLFPLQQATWVNNHLI